MGGGERLLIGVPFFYLFFYFGNSNQDISAIINFRAALLEKSGEVSINLANVLEYPSLRPLWRNVFVFLRYRSQVAGNIL